MWKALPVPVLEGDAFDAEGASLLMRIDAALQSSHSDYTPPSSSLSSRSGVSQLAEAFLSLPISASSVGRGEY